MPDTTGKYALATGGAAAHRLNLLHQCYSPSGRRVLLQAGLLPGMHVADFGCGVGEVSRMLGEMVGPTGKVTGIDVSADQLEQGRHLCSRHGVHNVTFHEASAYETRLHSGSFDLAYCRFLLLHLTDPARALHEMRCVLRPGGILVIEDGNLLSATSVPPSSLDAFADLWRRLGPKRNLDYALADRVWHLVRDAGFPDPQIEIHQPAVPSGDTRHLLRLSVLEMGSSCVAEGLLTEQKHAQLLVDMERDDHNPDILVLMPRMSQVWARKPA